MLRKKALVADDVELNREILSGILESEYDVLEACNGLEVLEILEREGKTIDVLFLDMVMPEMDGITALRIMSETGWNQRIPVLIVSAEQNGELQSQCFKYGVVDFIQKPYDPLLILLRANNAVELYKYKHSLENKIEEQLEELKEKNARLERINSDVVELLGDVVEARNLESGQHVRRVKQYTYILAKEVMKRYPVYCLNEEKIRTISSASALHDIGKIKIADSVLLKPGKLTPEEYEQMKQHTMVGIELIQKAVQFWGQDYVDAANEIIRGHHERYDGRGYPDGLKGDAIPISAQLVGVADVYDALTTERPYKSAFSPEKAYEMILNGECGAFSKPLMDCFVHCREKFEQLALTIDDGILEEVYK